MRGSGLDESLKESYQQVFNACLMASYELPEGVANVRPSYLNFKNTVMWGQSVENGMAAALMTLNSDHGCFSDAFDFIEKFLNKDVAFVQEHATIMIVDKIMIPGFGNPVIKTHDDRVLPIKDELSKITDAYKVLSDTVEEVFKSRNLPIFSNLAFWCAATAHVLKLRKENASTIPLIGFLLSYTSKIRLWPLQPSL